MPAYYLKKQPYQPKQLFQLLLIKSTYTRIAYQEIDSISTILLSYSPHPAPLLLFSALH